ncbi:helix-turn-helix domain-containing protein [Variovorax sp. LG9.2]|uniref:helix-turn-helix domain-containing protein n=1 Tax=Variovorax sp. LG9.2 TaxID=3048626 RepID=UPI002B235094|nr:helix-turn-helix domain-containing protein [Variovorax sp. LG9.2]MEB0059248.1 helix-turn-helix domain-containing protein [Variovorax sp. LG9.2]
MLNAPNEKARCVNNGPLEITNQQHDRTAILGSKSTAGRAQRLRIIEALRLRPQTSYDLRRLGCYQAPARIKELRDKFGFNIQTVRVTLVDRDGYSHSGSALYVLHEFEAAE